MGLSKKIILGFVIIGFLLAIIAPGSYETKAMDLWYFSKEFVIKPLVRKIANSLENKMVNKVAGFVSGVDSKTPTFILNWRNHMLDSQARGNDVFRSVLADTKLCSYFDKDLKKAFGADKYTGALNAGIVKNAAGNILYRSQTGVPGVPSFQSNANCTMPSSFKAEDLQKDFKKGGGWAAWNALIQPQNNLFGAFTLALEEQGRQMETENTSARDEAIAGSGFLSQKLSANGKADSIGCTDKNEFGTLSTPRCVFQGKTLSPAEIIGESAANALDAKLSRIGGATELTDVLLKLADAVTTSLSNRLTNFTGQKTYEAAPGGDNFDTSNVPTTDPNQDGLIKQGQGECVRLCLIDEEARCNATPTVSPDPDPTPTTQSCADIAKTTCDSKCSASGSP